MAPTTTYSGSTSASPAPFSPFSSGFSVSSEATFVSDERADLGAFQSVFHALSQLQLHHSQQHSTATGNSSHNGTPSIRGDPMSPLSLTSLQASPPPSAPFDVTNYPFRSLSAGILSDRSGSTIDKARVPSASAASTTPPSSAAEDGDEESAGVSGSPHSLSDTSVTQDVFERLLVREDDTSPDGADEDPATPGLWMYSEISPYHANFQDSSSNSHDSSPKMTASTFIFDMDPSVDEDGTPSLGDLQSAFAFFAAERAKLTAQLEPTAGASTVVTGSPAVKPKNKNKTRRKEKKNSPKVLEDGDSGSFGSEDAVPTETGTNISVEKPSSSDMEENLETKKQPTRGILQISRQKTITQADQLLLPPRSPTKSQRSTQNQTLATPTRGKQGKHKHSRSLPSSSVTFNHPTTPIPPSYVAHLRSLARRMSHHFPKNAATLRKVAKDPVVALGLGTQSGPSDEDLVAGGFYDPPLEGSANHASTKDKSLLYVFVDHSNILIGFLEWLKRQGTAGGKGASKPRLSHPALALLLERGRRCARKVLVASSPLYQSLDGLAGMSYQISVLQRVEIKEGASGTSTPSTHKPGSFHRRSSSSSAAISSPFQPSSLSKAFKKGKKKAQLPSPPIAPVGVDAGDSTESDSAGNLPGAGDTIVQSPHAPFVSNNNRGSPVKRGHHRKNSSFDQRRLFTATASSLDSTSIQGARPRYREEAVDELLQLKVLQTLLDAPSPPPAGSTIVLASGDGARSQFNPQGFLGCVTKALERGWKVEVVGWEDGRSRAWVDLKDEVDRIATSGNTRGTILANGGGFEIISLDTWGLDLLETTS